MKKGEKTMEKLQQQKENKTGILEDMLSFSLRGMLPSRWFERKPVTQLAGRQAVSKGVSSDGGV